MRFIEPILTFLCICGGARTRFCLLFASSLNTKLVDESREEVNVGMAGNRQLVLPWVPG